MAGGDGLTWGQTTATVEVGETISVAVSYGMAPTSEGITSRLNNLATATLNGPSSVSITGVSAGTVTIASGTNIGSTCTTTNGFTLTVTDTIPKYLDKDGLDYYDSLIATEIDGKQDTLTAGTGISISNNVISATGGGVADSVAWGHVTGTMADQTDLTTALAAKANSADLATVATSGDYDDLTDKPTIGNATLTIQKNGTSAGTFTANATSNKTINITVPTTAADVSALPASTKYGASIAVSINTTDYKVTTTLKDQDGNTLGTAQVIDLPLESVVVNGSYDSTNKKIVLTLQNGNTIDIPVGDLVAGLQSEITSTNKLASDLVDDTNQTHKFMTSAEKTKLSGIAAGAEVNVQSDWDQTTTTADDYIKNKPSLATVATSGSYNDLSNKPTIPTVNNGTLTVQKNGTNVATFTANQSGNSTANITVPTKTSDLTNDSGFLDSVAWGDVTGKPTFATVATSGSYNDLSNKPTIPTVNNATLTIQKNGTNVQTFTANQSTNATANITVPTNTNELTNGAGFITSSGTAAKANQLTTARTIAISGGVTGTATSFDGTSNISIPVTYVRDAYTIWGGKDLVSEISPDDAGCTDEFGHNKLAYLPAECIEVWRTVDGGSSWVLDSGVSSATKTALVTTSGAASPIYATYLENTITADNIAKLRSRIRIACGPRDSSTKLYTALKKILINFNTNGAGSCKVKMRRRTIANYLSNTETWEDLGTHNISGWSGWNSYPYSGNFGGSMTTQTGQWGQIEFEFWAETYDSRYSCRCAVLDIRFIGTTNWTMPSELARAGHLYTIDTAQNATFPANVNVTGSLGHGNYTYTLPSKNGTVAMTSDLPAAQVNSDWNASSGVAQILNKPTLATVATSGSYNDLSNKPTIPTVNNATLTIQKNGSTVKTFTANASSNVTANITVPTATSDLTNDSNFVADASYVHTDNNYTTTDKNKLAGIASGAEVNVQANWTQTTTTADDYIKNKPTLATVATSGSYNDLSNKPTIPTVNNATLTIQKNGSTVKTFTANASSNVTANITVPTKTSDITNDSNFVASGDLATVATSGSYNDLSNKPTIPAAQVQSNWTQTTTTAVDYIKNKPTLATVATSGSYNDLSNKPTIPTVNNATLTIQKNGTNVQTFTANASSNKTANIIVPTALSDLSGTVATSQIADGAVTPAKIALGSLFVAAPTLSSQISVVANSYTDSQTMTLGAGTWQILWMIRGFGDSASHQQITGRLAGGSTEIQSITINALSLSGSLRYQIVGGCTVTPTASTVYKAQIKTPMASYISTSSYLFAIRIG